VRSNRMVSYRVTMSICLHHRLHALVHPKSLLHKRCLLCGTDQCVIANKACSVCKVFLKTREQACHNLHLATTAPSRAASKAIAPTWSCTINRLLQLRYSYNKALCAAVPHNALL
jgi:hypothetical protein